MMQPTTREEDGAIVFDWGAGLSIEARNIQKTRMGVRATIKVLDLASEESPVVGMDTLIIDNQGDRDRFSTALNRRDGKVADWDAKLLLVAENLGKRAEDGERHKPLSVVLDTVEREEVSWLWPDRMPLGKLTIIEGDPGCGKSWLTLAIAAAVTTGGSLPGDSEPQPVGKVLLLTAEDGLADTVRPRAEDMGADLSRIVVLQGIEVGEGKERHFSLVDDLDALEEMLAGGDFRYVVIDPVNAYLGTDLDTHRDAAIRSVLTPLAALAEKYGVAIICIRHLTKSGKDKAIYRGLGSIGYGAAARVVLLVGLNPEDESERVVVCNKNNLTAFPPALAFEISEGRFRWRGETSVTVAALLAPEQGGEERSAVDEAVEFLREMLSDGARTAREVERQADAVGISKMTLRRARKTLEVKANPVRQEGRTGVQHWTWELSSDGLGVQEKHEPLNPNSYLEAPEQVKGDEHLNPPLELGGQDADAGERDYCLSLATELAYPRLEFAPGNTVPAGEDDWQRFVQRMDMGGIKAAIGVLEGLRPHAGT
ncbi:MAG: AAA family ATPase [Chloroflexi bacterium]|nr:AAA family ATPase [Chloroflexota bacterium]